MSITPANLPGAPGRFQLDRHVELALADAPVFKVNGNLDQAEMQLFAQVGHLDLEAVAVAADVRQADGLQGPGPPALETRGQFPDAPPQAGAAVQVCHPT